MKMLVKITYFHKLLIFNWFQYFAIMDLPSHSLSKNI